MGLLRKYTEEISGINSIDDVTSFKDHLSTYSSEIDQLSDADSQDVHDFLVACVKCGNRDVVAFAAVLVSRKKAINWNSHCEIFEAVLSALCEYGKQPVEASKLFNRNDYREKDFFQKFINLLKSGKGFKQCLGSLCKLIQTALSTRSNRLLLLPKEFTSDIVWMQNMDRVNDILTLSHDIIQSNPGIPKDEDYSSCLASVLWNIFMSWNNKVKPALKVKDLVAKLYLLVANAKWYTESGALTLEGHLVTEITQGYYEMQAYEGKELLRPVFSTILELADCEDDQVREIANSVFLCMKGNDAATLGGVKFVRRIVARYISGEDTSTVANFMEMYNQYPLVFDENLLAIAETMNSGQDWCISMVLALLCHVASKQPDVYTPELLEICMAQLTDDGQACTLFGLLKSLAIDNPELIRPHDDKIIEAMNDYPMVSALGAELIQIIVNTEEKAEQYIEVMKNLIPNCDSTRQTHHIINMQKIGEKYPTILKPYEAYLKTLLTTPDLQPWAQAALDFLAGISLTSVSKDTKKVKENVKIVDKKVTRTEKKTEVVQNNLDDTNKAVKKVKVVAEEQNVRQEELKEVVEETRQKVKELDAKMVSRIPKWCQDVAKLLAGKDDWKALAKKLGFSEDEFNTWAENSNPCMILFYEWFAQHRKFKDTETLFGHLTEMEKSEACLLVENALKLTEDVVPNEDFNYQTPPVIFISYQWGLQPQALLLQNHLKMAGYDSWLDFGQMGGGLKLLDKIDSGIRQCKVMLCCVSQKYAKSGNSNREVNLAVNLKKPMIPLLMEKLNWPPPGTMGPIFGEMLFIRFFQREGEFTVDNRYWPEAKFTELIHQVQHYQEPSKAGVHQLYEKWWVPEDIVAEKVAKQGNSVVIIKPQEQENKVLPEQQENQASVTIHKPEEKENKAPVEKQENTYSSQRNADNITKEDSPPIVNNCSKVDELNDDSKKESNEEESSLTKPSDVSNVTDEENTSLESRPTDLSAIDDKNSKTKFKSRRIQVNNSPLKVKSEPLHTENNNSPEKQNHKPSQDTVGKKQQPESKESKSCCLL